MAEVAFNMYFNDVKAIVKKGVEADICKMVTEDEVHSRTLADSRRRKLKLWLASGQAILHFDNYVELLRAIASTSEQVATGLPGMDRQELSTLKFAETLYDMANDSTKHPVRVPVLRKGAFYPALKVAVAQISKLTTKDNVRPFVVQVLWMTTELLKIHFIPWTPTQVGPGRPARNPVWVYEDP